MFSGASEHIEGRGRSCERLVWTLAQERLESERQTHLKLGHDQDPSRLRHHRHWVITNQPNHTRKLVVCRVGGRGIGRRARRGGKDGVKERVLLVSAHRTPSDVLSSSPHPMNDSIPHPLEDSPSSTLFLLPPSRHLSSIPPTPRPFCRRTVASRHVRSDHSNTSPNDVHCGVPSHRSTSGAAAILS